MANREIGTGPLAVYLALWWGFVIVLALWLTSNSAPEAPELAFKEPAYYVTTKVQVDIVKPSVDADSDLVEYEYTWSKDGQPVEGQEGHALSIGSVRKGETWTVRVEPNDGSKNGVGCGIWPAWRTCAGEIAATAEVTIQNSPPTARVRVRDASDKDVAALTGSDLHLVLACYDADLVQAERDAAPEGGAPAPAEGAPEKPDPCTYKIAWYAGDAPAIAPAAAAAPAEGAAAPAEGAAPAEAKPVPTPKFTDVTTVSARDLKASKIWRIHVIANDGEVDGPISEIVLEPEAE